jgi:hypothetical protein
MYEQQKTAALALFFAKLEKIPKWWPKMLA